MFLNPHLFKLPLAEIRSIGEENLIYGSLTDKGLKTLVNIISYYSSEYHEGLDLGCGDGELVYHLGLAFPNSSWKGVEISEHRVDLRTRDVDIWQGDMLKENLRPYNILHADNLCLEEQIANTLEEKIAREFTGLYISYRRAQSFQFLKKARLLKSEWIQTTWTNHLIHFYILL